MSDPTPVNPIVKTVDEIIQAILYDLGVNAAVTYITTQVPFLGLPFFRQVTQIIVGKIAGILYKYLEQFLTFSIIDFQTHQQAQDYLKAVQALEVAQTSGDPNAINKAIADFKETMDSLVHFNGIS